MLKGLRDRWDLPMKNLQKTMDQSVILIEKTISYLENVQQVTAKVSILVDKVECFLERETELKKLEEEKIQLEIEILKKRRARILKLEKKSRTKGGRGN